jgi:hypothetical protein
MGVSSRHLTKDRTHRSPLPIPGRRSHRSAKVLVPKRLRMFLLAVSPEQKHIEPRYSRKRNTHEAFQDGPLPDIRHGDKSYPIPLVIVALSWGRNINCGQCVIAARFRNIPSWNRRLRPDVPFWLENPKSSAFLEGTHRLSASATPDVYFIIDNHTSRTHP